MIKSSSKEMIKSSSKEMIKSPEDKVVRLLLVWWYTCVVHKACMIDDQ